MIKWSRNRAGVCRLFVVEFWSIQKGEQFGGDSLIGVHIDSDGGVLRRKLTKWGKEMDFSPGHDCLGTFREGESGKLTSSGL